MDPHSAADNRSLEVEWFIAGRQCSLLDNRFIEGCIYFPLFPNAYFMRSPRSESKDQINCVQMCLVCPFGYFTSPKTQTGNSEIVNNAVLKYSQFNFIRKMDSKSVVLVSVILNSGS